MLLTTFSRAIIVFRLLLVGQTTWAATTLVAVASDFTKPMTEIAAAFEKATGHTRQTVVWFFRQSVRANSKRRAV